MMMRSVVVSMSSSFAGLGPQAELGRRRTGLLLYNPSQLAGFL